MNWRYFMRILAGTQLTRAEIKNAREGLDYGYNTSSFSYFSDDASLVRVSHYWGPSAIDWDKLRTIINTYTEDGRLKLVELIDWKGKRESIEHDPPGSFRGKKVPTEKAA